MVFESKISNEREELSKYPYKLRSGNKVLLDSALNSV